MCWWYRVITSIIEIISAEQELEKLQHQYRVMDGERRAYCEESQNVIRKQQYVICYLTKQSNEFFLFFLLLSASSSFLFSSSSFLFSSSSFSSSSSCSSCSCSCSSSSSTTSSSPSPLKRGFI